MLESVLVAAVIGLAAAMVASVGVLIYIAATLSRAHKEISDFLTATRAELTPALQQMRQTLGEVDSAASGVRGRLERADKILRTVECLLDGTTLAVALSRTAKTSGGTIAAVLEGVREALRVLRKPAGNSEEEGK